MYAFLSDSSKQANILVDRIWIISQDEPFNGNTSSVLPSEFIKSGKVFPRVGICWSKTVALQYARPGCQDHHHHHHHHLVAQPVDDVEGVEEALRRLWVKEGSKVTVGVNLLQALLDLRICVKEEEDLPESSRHDQGFGIQRQPVFPPGFEYD